LQAEIKAQKEELQRQREALQRQVDHFEEQRGQFFRSLVSLQERCNPPATTSSANYNANDPSSAPWPTSAIGSHRSPPDGGSSASSNHHYPHHHRSASDDRMPGSGRQLSPTGPARCNTEEGVGTLQTSGSSGRTPGDCGTSGGVRSGPRVPAVGVFRRDTMPPMHLLSATNEARAGLVQPQQLPLKLASSSLSSDPRDAFRLSRGAAAAGQPLQPLGAAALSQPNGGRVPNDRDSLTDMTSVGAVSPMSGGDWSTSRP
jgi:hypothetical protein